MDNRDQEILARSQALRSLRGHPGWRLIEGYFEDRQNEIRDMIFSDDDLEWKDIWVLKGSGEEIKNLREWVESEINAGEGVRDV